MSELDLSTRVVVLSPDAAGASQEAADLRDEGIEVVRVTTAYEAAAELIAAPAAALVVDLRLLGPRHLRLLTIARESQVEILAVGGLPPGMNSEDLSGVRLTSRADVAATLKKLIGAAPLVAAPPSDDLSAMQDERLDAEQDGALDEDTGEDDAEDPAAPAELVPAKVSAEEIAQELDYRPADAPPPPPVAAAPVAEPAPAAAPAAEADENRTLLTPEELAALLENEA